MKDILLVGNYLPDKQESMQRFAEVMLRELQVRGYTVTLVRPFIFANRFRKLPAIVAKWLGYIDKFILFPFFLRKMATRFDVVHICDHSNAYYVNFIGQIPHIINCHDLIAIRSALGLSENVTGWTGKRLQRLVMSGLQRASHIACISQNTRRDLIDLLDVPPRNAVVIYMGMNYPYQPMSESESVKHIKNCIQYFSDNNGEELFFIFHVGGNQWYKNRIGVLKIFKELVALQISGKSPKLIMAGRPFDQELRDFVKSHHLEECVVEVQGCSNEELRAFYSKAQVLLFPSLAEGFGWPVVEAQACGCPVLTSNFAPLTEIGGDAAVYCDPKDETEAAKRLNAMLCEDKEARKMRSQESIENSKLFSTQKMVDAYVDLYNNAIEEHLHKNE